MNIGPTELIVVLMVGVMGVAPLALCLWGVFDAVNRPEHDWAAVGQSKTTWVLLQAIGTLTCVGIVFVVYYLASIRPKLVAVQQQSG